MDFRVGVWARGRAKLKVEPFLSLDLNQILPFMRSIISLMINKPKPVPGMPLAASSSTRKKRVNIFSWSFLDIPTPSSLTWVINLS